MYFQDCLAQIITICLDASFALSGSFWELNISLFSIYISGPYYFFCQNLGMGSIEGSVILGSMLLYGSFGVTAIEASCNRLIEILLKAHKYIMYIDAVAYAEISIEIEILLSLQLEISGELSHCKNDLSPLWHSCGYGPLRKCGDFILLFIRLFVRIILIWCNICSADPGCCDISAISSTMSSVVNIDVFECDNFYVNNFLFY